MTSHIIASQVLILCNDIEMGRIWSFALGQRGIDTFCVTTVQQALEVLTQSGYDLVLVDICTTELCGRVVCQQLRKEFVVPILLLDTIRQEDHILTAYKEGVDEYIIKPVSPALLLAKVQVWLKRARIVPVDAREDLQVGDLRLDPLQRVLNCGGKRATRLTHLEFRLLYLLMSNYGKTLPSSFLVSSVWGVLGDGDHVLLKNLVYRLRKKIEPEPGTSSHFRFPVGRARDLYHELQPRADRQHPIDWWGNFHFL
jgi:two-component system response regulator RegX3